MIWRILLWVLFAIGFVTITGAGVHYYRLHQSLGRAEQRAKGQGRFGGYHQKANAQDAERELNSFTPIFIKLVGISIVLIGGGAVGVQLAEEGGIS